MEKEAANIDLSKEETREQLGFKDIPLAEPQSASDIVKAAREKAACVNAAADQHQSEKCKDKGQEID